MAIAFDAPIAFDDPGTPFDGAVPPAGRGVGGVWPGHFGKKRRRRQAFERALVLTDGDVTAALLLLERER